MKEKMVHNKSLSTGYSRASGQPVKEYIALEFFPYSGVLSTAAHPQISVTYKMYVAETIQLCRLEPVRVLLNRSTVNLKMNSKLNW